MEILIGVFIIVPLVLVGITCGVIDLIRWDVNRGTGGPTRKEWKQAKKEGRTF